MNTNKFFKIIKTLSLTGIHTAVLEDREGNLLIRGTDKDAVTFVFHTEEGNDITELPIGLDDITPIVNKLGLFDISKTAVDLDTSDTCVERITFKEGRKKVNHSLTSASSLELPKNINFDEIKNTLILTKDVVNDISKAINTFNPEKVTLTGVGSDIVLKFEDKDSNTFEDVMGSNSSGDWSYTWMKDKFIKLIKTYLSESEEDSISLVISERGVLYFDINDIIIMLFPTPE